MCDRVPLRVIELFAGVGGFRLGLEGIPGEAKVRNFEVVWSNQWEPKTKTQHASLIYEARFGKEGHSNQDISEVDVSSIPDADVLVGGFPCQDYSVANSLRTAKGLIGHKGILWWQIYRILEAKNSCRPQYLILENVDRLLKSPATQRGRDFAVMLASLGSLGYKVEWRVINAADYGMPQRRRRVFILAYRNDTKLAQAMKECSAKDWLDKKGVFASAFPSESLNETFLFPFSISSDLIEISREFNAKSKTGALASPFLQSGIFIDGEFFTSERKPIYNGPRTNLGEVLESEPVAPEFYIPNQDLEKWKYLKGAKNEQRMNRDGHSYNYTEGAIAFPDYWDRPSRTIITSEGGFAPSRFKHIILTESGKYRRLTPIELERLNMFPDDFTMLSGIGNAKRAFIMGNALIIGVVNNIGDSLIAAIDKY